MPNKIFSARTSHQNFPLNVGYPSLGLNHFFESMNVAGWIPLEANPETEIEKEGFIYSHRRKWRGPEGKILHMAY